MQVSNCLSMAMAILDSKHLSFSQKFTLYITKLRDYEVMQSVARILVQHAHMQFIAPQHWTEHTTKSTV